MVIPEQYFKAGKIAARVREEAKELLRPGLSILELCETVEERITSLGGQPAFPCNVSINEVAAHNTARPNDDSKLGADDLVKVDIGVHIDGYIADTATTVTLNPKYEPLVEATEEALNTGLAYVTPQTRTGMVGRQVESIAKQRGFLPIKNLGGHNLEPYTIHGGKHIPNIWVSSTPFFNEGEVYAIEPFLTTFDGAGEVVDAGTVRIYSLITRKKTSEDLNNLVNIVWARFRTLPFTARWLTDVQKPEEIEESLAKLEALKILRGYPVLVEGRGKPVAQFEHTVAPTSQGVLILTQP
jgi:methionyl aminopeptidase